MQTIFTALLALSLYATISCHHRYSNLTSCSVQGITHVRSFMSTNRVDSCYQYGARVLYDSPNIKVTSHSYMNETTMTVDWASTKLFIEFYGDIIGLPIALFSSDILECPCAGPCLTSRTSDKAFSLGVNGAVDLVMREQGESRVAYLYYKRANVSLYVRYTPEGYNFGIRVPEYLSIRAAGVCVTGCPRVVDQSAMECLRDEYIQPAVNVCRQVFADLQSYYSADVNFEEARILPCARDVFIWRNARSALSHRYAYIDELLLANYSSIIQRYSDLVGNFVFNWVQYDGIVDKMVRDCVDKAAPSEDTLSFTPVSGNKTAPVGRLNVIDLSGEDAPRNKTDLLLFTPILAEPTDNTSTIRIDLSNDRFIDVSPVDDTVLAVEKEMAEWRVKCKNLRTTQLGIFYLTYTANETFFVQCDESNRAFLKQCPLGTIFTVRMVCEPATIVKAPKLSDIINGKAPLQIDVVRPLNDQPIVTSTSTTSVVMPTMILNPCTNSTRAQGLFFFPHPTDATMFIQCDGSNSMAIGQCVTGTRFSVATRSCQKF